MMQGFDIAIIGGGMVGLSFAAALRHTDLRIAVIEMNSPSVELSDSPDIRVSALSRASETILKNLQVWDGIVQQRISTYLSMQVWEKDSFAAISFSAASLCQPDLGHIVENSVIQRSLLEQVRKQSNISLFMPNRCQTIVRGETEVWLTLDNGMAMTAKLVVGADGPHSWVRDQANIPLVSRDYGHSALVATVKTEEPHQRIARQIFTPDGPLAFLPLSDAHLCSVVWSTAPARAQALYDMPDAAFNQAIDVAFDHRLGCCQVVSERSVLPLKMRYARDFAAERIALMGDAAHTIHPLAGQGVNLGFLDAASLAQIVIALWQDGKDIGLRRNLRPYERWRKTEAMTMIVAMQGIRALFAGQDPVKKLLRGMGMALFNELPLPKEELMKIALGLTGELPDLAVG